MTLSSEQREALQRLTAGETFICGIDKHGLYWGFKTGGVCSPPALEMATLHELAYIEVHVTHPWFETWTITEAGRAALAEPREERA